MLADIAWGVTWNASLTTTFYDKGVSMSVADEQVIRDHLDLEMLERPHLWPAVRRGMRCVFVKRENARQSGPCFQLEDGSYMIMATDFETEGLTVTPHPYPTASAITGAGWIVD